MNPLCLFYSLILNHWNVSVAVENNWDVFFPFLRWSFSAYPPSHACKQAWQESSWTRKAGESIFKWFKHFLSMTAHLGSVKLALNTLVCKERETVTVEVRHFWEVTTWLCWAVAFSSADRKKRRVTDSWTDRPQSSSNSIRNTIHLRLLSPHFASWATLAFRYLFTLTQLSMCCLHVWGRFGAGQRTCPHRF